MALLWNDAVPPVPDLVLSADAAGNVTADLQYGTCTTAQVIDSLTFQRLVEMIESAPREKGLVSVAESGDPTVTIEHTDGSSEDVPMDGRTGSILDQGKTLNRIYDLLSRLQFNCAPTQIHSVSYFDPNPSGVVNFTVTLDSLVPTINGYVKSGESCETDFLSGPQAISTNIIAASYLLAASPPDA